MKPTISKLLLLCSAVMYLGATLLALPAAAAQYCVRCTDPAQTYICNVETGGGLQNDKGLQLFCIIRTSRDGGHRSCAVDQQAGIGCAGIPKTYTFNAPAIPESVRRAIAKRRQDATPESGVPPQQGGEPETLIDLTRGAVGASKKSIQNTGEAVGSAAGTTKEKVGQAARGVGKGVAAVTGKVGSATKKTGSAVGGAAKSAWDCVKSLFKDCRSSEPDVQ